MAIEAAAPNVPLRRRLFLLAIAALVPLTLIAGLGLFALVANQREEARRGGIELTRALATAVDAELGRSVSVMEALVTTPTLDTGDLAGFHRRAVRVMTTQPYWRSIVLVLPNGQPVVDSSHPLGAALPLLSDPNIIDPVLRTAAPMIGGLAAARPADGAGSPLEFSVQVPVMRAGELRYVAVAFVDPHAILAILSRQRVPADWVISIFDASGRRVARSRAHDETLGKPGSPSVVALMAGPQDEGWGRTNAVEGDPIYTAYSRAKTIRWTVATGIPLAAVDGAVWRTASTFGGGLLLSVLIGMLAASLVARSITGPIAALRSAAEALGRREPIAAPDTAISEIQRVAQALVDAAAERARGERERDTLLEREQHAREAAETANRAKDEFLAMLGHELRNPLGAVSSAVAVLDHASPASPAAASARQIITRQTAHLARLTDDLLDAARAITGKIVLARLPIDLAEVVARALATIDVGRHRLVRDLRSVWVNGDATRIEQIVVNLVGNAAKYSAEEGTIAVSVHEERGSAVLRVRDDGVGMSPELTARVFDLFVQGHRTLDRSSGGLGIGLTLVQRLAQLHGGRAEAASAGPGRGSELTVRFPEIPAVAAAARARPAALRTNGGARDVLVIEDNEDARTALCKLLELGGHRVRAAHDGPSALAITQEAQPEIALIDVGLPGIDGYEVARRLRAASRDITLVALTGYGLPEDRARALEAGFDVHLVKPVDLAVLTKLLAG